jgi:hypothetical protein
LYHMTYICSVQQRVCQQESESKICHKQFQETKIKEHTKVWFVIFMTPAPVQGKE